MSSAKNHRTVARVGSHKLFAPPVRAGAVGRRGILDRVLHQRPLQVTVLQGPAGSGKSTTLQQIMSACEARGWSTAWLSFDDADNDPRRFETHLQALLAVVLHQGDVPGLEASGPDSPLRPSTADWLLDSLSKLDTPVALFFDEFQALRHDAILQLFRSVLPRLPAQLRVFIGSRTLPEVGLATLLVNGVAGVLRAQDLRFSAQEAGEFFASDTGLNIAPDEMDVIYQRTEGWPAGLQLFRLALASPEVRTSLDEVAVQGPRELAEYLTDNVVTLQPPPMQEFLLRTALLRRLSGPLCDAVMGRPGSQQLLLELERSGLFLSALDANAGWFKYHGLFAQFLAGNLARHAPDDVRDVHERAARWHLAQASYDEAVYHALQARHRLLAVTAFNAGASPLVAAAELVTVERWYDALSIDDVAGHIDLAVKVAYALIFQRRRAKLRPLLAYLGRHRGQGSIADTTSPDVVLAMAALFEDDVQGAALIAHKPEVHQVIEQDFPAFELGAAANLLAFAKIEAGEYEAARKLLVLARTHNSHGGAAFSGGYTAAVSGVLSMMRGDLREALKRFEIDASAPQARLDKSIAATSYTACHLWALYEDNQLERVESLGRQYQPQITNSVIPDFIAVALLSMSRAYQIRGKQTQAVEALDALELIGHESAWPRLVQLAEWERVRRALALGDVARATAMAERISPGTGPDTPHGPAHCQPVSEAMEGPVLGQIRLFIHQGRHAAAARALATQMAIRPERPYMRLKLWILDALLQHHKGQFNAAHRSLRRALEQARPGGHVRSFLDEGDTIAAMLRQEYQCLLAQHDVATPSPTLAEERAYLERLLAACGIDLSRPAPQAGARELEPLSEREKEILRYLCEGVSNKDIAARLFVSENTIKFHLKKVFAKLDVRNRSQAINAAHDLHLVRMASPRVVEG